MYQAALARSVADQLYGYNMSRGYTLAARGQGFDGLLTIGRVQTPILGLVINRDRQHEAHNKSFYYELRGNFTVSPDNSFTAKYKPTENCPIDEKGRVTSEEFLKAVIADCTNNPAKINTATTETKQASPPLPFFWGCSAYPECKQTYPDKKGKPDNETTKSPLLPKMRKGSETTNRQKRQILGLHRIP
jgi:DNA topoisomerase-3